MRKVPLTLRHFRQSPAFCGPAALKIALAYFGKNFSERTLARWAHATRPHGTEHAGMIRAAQKAGAHVFVKERGTISELARWVHKKGVPVIVGWFDRDGDHYSVVAAVGRRFLTLVDPAHHRPRRRIARTLFQKVWFDFVGRNNARVSWGWYMVVDFLKN